MSQNTPKRRAALYLRISADPNKTEHGIAAQRADCLELAEREGLEVVGEYADDDRSAFRDGVVRDNFERLLTDMTHDLFDVVVVWVSDRLYRRNKDLARITDILQTYPVQVTQVKGGEIDLTTADGILRAQMLGSVAEFESRRKSERITLRAQHRAKVELRTVASRLTTGWRWVDPCPGGEACRHPSTCERPGMRPIPGSRAGIEPEPSEAVLVVRGYEMIERGETLASVARMFDASGIPARVTDRWKPSTIRRALLNPRNAGLVTYKGEVVGEAASGHRLVSVEQWEKVHRILTDSKRRTSPGRPANTIMSGIARCSVCDGPMNAGRKTSRSYSGADVTAPAYVCGREQHQTKRRHIVDGAVLEEVRGWVVDNAANVAAHTSPTAGPTQRAAAQEVTDLNDRLGAVRRMAVDGTMPPEDAAAMLTDLRANLADAERRAVVAAGRPETAKLLAADDVGAYFDALAADTNVVPLRALLSELLDKVVIVKGKPGVDGVRVHWAKWAVEAVAA